MLLNECLQLIRSSLEGFVLLHLVVPALKFGAAGAWGVETSVGLEDLVEVVEQHEVNDHGLLGAKNGAVGRFSHLLFEASQVLLLEFEEVKFEGLHRLLRLDLFCTAVVNLWHG